MRRPANSSVAVSALALTAIMAVVAPRAFSAGQCADVNNDRQRHQCRASVMPKSYSVDEMGMPAYGGGTQRPSDPARSVAKLRGPSGTPDVSFTLRAAYGRTSVAGRHMRAYTLNGSTPGPTLYATKGDLVKVTLVNRNIKEGTSLHWHGLDVPDGEDGVAGVTQNAVRPRHQFVYRFIADHVGTYWYHSHQYSERQVQGGLIGALVITPAGAPTPPASARDVVAVAHSYRGRGTINGATGSHAVSGDVGGRRIRFVNTNQTAMRIAATVPFQIAAIDGYDVHGPTDVSTSRYVEVPAAGRVDVVLDPSASGARVGLVGGPSLVLGGGSPPKLTADAPVDLLRYGAPNSALHVPKPDRTFNFVIGQRSGYLDGRRGTWFSINRKLIPDVPMFMANKGDDVRVRFTNRTPIDHPMHLHGTHMLVLSRDGVASKGAPWWVDTLEVHPGETFVTQFHATNRGDWMFHCHILAHAAAGLMTHVHYLNVRNPYRIGQVSRSLTNHPE